MKNLKISPAEPECEERYRLLTENAGDTIWAVDLTGKLTYISPSVERLCGFTPEECLARSLDEALTPASMTLIREDTQKIVAEAASGEPLKPHHLELEFIHKNGSAVWVEVSSKAMLNAAGKLIGIQGICRDISERKRAEEALRESEARYRSLFENAVEGIVVAEMKTRRFLRANPAFCKMLGYSSEEISAMGVENIHPAERLEYVVGEFNALASGKKVLTVEVPCLRKDGTILYADIAGSAILIDGKICNVGFFTDVTERKKLNDALRESEERFKQVAESAGEWIWEVDTDGLYTFASPAVEKILGYKPGEIIGKMHFYDFFVPDEREAFKKTAFEVFGRKGAFRGFVNQNLHKNGNRVILETSGVPCLDEQGRLIGYRGADTDITERRKAEEALRESEERYRQLVDKTDTGFVVVDDQGIVIEANEPYMRLIGAEKLEEITGHSVIEWTAPEAQESNAAAVALCARQGFIQDFETIYLHRIGSRLHININATTHETPEGKRLISFCRNITKRKQMEEALRESEMRLRTVIEAVQEGITFSDKKGYFEAYNSRMEKLTGYSSDEANASSDFTTLLYPDPKDREKALAGLSELTTTGMSREAETKIRTKDGTQKYILVSTTLIPYKDQRMFLSSYHDISERKLLEAELRRQSIVDELTGLFNRRGFLTLAEQQLKFAERAKKSLVLFFMDLDHMKWINDTLGHQEGDRALTEIAAVLRQTFRKSDIIGRMGGDEFAILAIDTAHEVGQTVARLSEALDSFNQSETRTYKLSLSLGTAHFDPDNPSSLDDLMARADNLMYREKRTKQQIRHGS